jgi:hypothetical protein
MSHVVNNISTSWGRLTKQRMRGPQLRGREQDGGEEYTRVKVTGTSEVGHEEGASLYRPSS